MKRTSDVNSEKPKRSKRAVGFAVQPEQEKLIPRNNNIPSEPDFDADHQSVLSLNKDNDIYSEESGNNVYNDKTDMISAIKQSDWKNPQNQSYETMCLTNSTLNCKIRPAGFRPNAKYRQIKNTCMISKMKTRCRIRGKPPQLAVCVTMFNEDEEELKTTIRGLLHNYNCLKMDK